ncbi:MAG: ATP12 family protein [Pseudomonadota bacterium]
MKRFWKETSISEDPDGFTINLDGRPVRTPARHACRVPRRLMAEEIAAEWQAQEEVVSPLSMPMTRVAATCLDRVAPEMDAVRDMITAYGGTDLLCYRATHPAELIARQTAGWDPVLDWAAETVGARLKTGSGVMHIAQPPSAEDALARRVRDADAWTLTGLSELVTISGSLVLGLAVLEQFLEAEAAWELSRIDEQWNIDEWGEDFEAAELAAKRQSDFLQAARVLDILRTQ